MNCYLVKDLLPNYIDGLVSEETEKDVQEHLRNCRECQILHVQMKTPIDTAPIQTDEKEINFLKKIKAKNIRSIIMGFTAIAFIFGILTWIFVIGTPVNSSDVTVTTRIDKVNRTTEDVVSTSIDGAYLAQEWVITFELTNGKALIERKEYTYEENKNGDKITTGVIITPYAVQPSSFLNECANYTWGYSYSGTEPPTSDFTVTVRYKDKDVVYSMTDEGLFELQ